MYNISDLQSEPGLPFGPHAEHLYLSAIEPIVPLLFCAGPSLLPAEAWAPVYSRHRLLPF